MEEVILISYLNDFIFCPVSIYFHKLYGNLDKNMYQSTYQISGTDSHKAIDEHKYSSRKNILQGIDIYSSEFGLEGKIDLFDTNKGILTERKYKVNKIYDGYVFQLYAQYYALTEMGYVVNRMRIHSIVDNKNYEIDIPKDNPQMDNEFRKLIDDIHKFDIEKFVQTNRKKCEQCIYEPSCDRSRIC